MKKPLVITGMHRSGTTLLVKLLSQRGLFFGAHLDPNLEDFFFLRRNEWLLRRAGGAWDRPMPVVEFLENSELRNEARALFTKHVHSWTFRHFTGWERALRSGGRPYPKGAWGWKDPRAVFSFPVWERVFPGCKLLYIRRNGVDVAASLRKRDLVRRREGRLEEGKLYRRGLLGRMMNAWQGIEFHDHYLFAARRLDLQAGFWLWEQYIDRGEKVFASYDGPKLAFSFEALVEEPEETLHSLASFAELDDAESAIDEWRQAVRPGRAHAFRSDPELCDFYETVRESRWMKELGYGELL
jgi:hypothetical protein